MVDATSSLETVVMNCGSYTCKIGSAADNLPIYVERNVCGRWRDGGANPKIGWDAAHSKYVTLAFPMKNSLVVDSESMEIVWEQLYSKKLQKDPALFNLLISQPFNATDINIDYCGQYMFETLKVPALCMPDESFLALYSHSQSTGVVLDCGYEHTTVIPIVNGKMIKTAIQHGDFGGKHLTKLYLEILLKRTPYSFGFKSPKSMQQYENVKIRMCYAALDPIAERTKPQEELRREYQLPDWQRIFATHERFECVETAYFDRKTNGVHYMVQEAVNQCEFSVRGNLLANIIICGGASSLEGFTERFSKEMKTLEPSARIIEQITPYGTYAGGAAFARNPDNLSSFATKFEYEEFGPSILRKWQRSSAKSARSVQ